jgi:hypothetical protein
MDVALSASERDNRSCGTRDRNDRAVLLDAYKQFTAFHCTQETLFWTRNNLLVLMQVGLIAALFALLSRKQPDEWHLIPVGGFGVALVGLVLTGAWIRMVERSRYLFDVALAIIAQAEERLDLGEHDCLFTFFYEASKTRTDDTNIESLPLSIERRLNSKFRRGGRATRLSTMWIKVGYAFAAAWFSTIAVIVGYCVRAR